MDPNATYKAFREAYLAGEMIYAKEQASYLETWLANGGHAPTALDGKDGRPSSADFLSYQITMRNIPKAN